MSEEKKPAVVKHFTKEQLENMSADDLAELLGNLPPDAKIKAKGVVRRADGTIKYDDPSKAGSYGE